MLLKENQLLVQAHRSERIRTYNYPQSRVTDHRIGLTLQKLNQIMEGNLDEIVEALTLSEQTEKLKELNNGNYKEKFAEAKTIAVNEGFESTRAEWLF